MKVWITRDVVMGQRVLLWMEAMPKFAGKCWKDFNQTAQMLSHDFCISAFGNVPDEGGILEVELKVVEVTEVVDDEKALARKLAEFLVERKRIHQDGAGYSYLKGSEHELMIKALKQFAQRQE